REIDTVTFSGSGEPTLSCLIGELIRDIKSFTAIPVTVLTNSSLLTRPDVRAELLAADRVVPSLDAVTQDVFERVNRPHSSLRIKEIIEGLKAFRSEFEGEIWLEVMLVKGINDGLSHIRRLREVIAELQPNRVQLNTVVRPPADAGALPLSREELEGIRSILGGTCEIVADFVRPASSGPSARLGEEILAMVVRRPVTLEDMRVSLGIHRDELLKSLDKLVEKGKIKRVRHRNKVFYEPDVP
ncbi:MAG: radical SAM protein, partial [Candidatus Aminicenantes bacterium]|nr:radical SAM protein [Candidatus Aminicenantes bacterium]